MTIKEIAELAGVSVSTVSKVMNGKDAGIRAETRERVLEIAKQYHYKPYAALQQGGRTLTIGVLVCDSAESDRILAGISETACEHGYSVLLKESKGTEEGELKGMAAFEGNHVDGVLWEPSTESSLALEDRLSVQGIPHLAFGSRVKDLPCIDYSTLGYAAVKALVDRGHESIACFAAQSGDGLRFGEGYRQCLFDNRLPFNEGLLVTDPSSSPSLSDTIRQASAAVFSGYRLAAEFLRSADDLHYSIPEDCSVISLREERYADLAFPALSTISVPESEFGRSLAKRLICCIEKRDDDARFTMSCDVDSAATIAAPLSLRRKRIVSFGSINIDNYLSFESLPTTGTSASSSTSSVYPGGKCLNEAVGAARLGHAVAAVGRVGDDADSDVIFGTLSSHGIDASAVERTAGTRTGQAYIFVEKTGASMISIMSGANSMLSAADVERHESVFRDAGICLLQTEVPLEAIGRAAALAKKHGATTIIKPSDCKALPESLLATIDILAPNLDELGEICPGEMTVEEKATALIARGVGTVIVTMGGEGCCVFDHSGMKHIDALKVASIDTTGAGDAFISALASYLLYGFDLAAAARIATYAAALSTLRQGVAPALVDRNTLEAYIMQREPELLG